MNTLDIKRRIKSVKNTKKITKAMELVSASKMRKAVSRVLATRSYAKVAWETLVKLSQKVDINLTPLFAKRVPIKNIYLIVISSNRGLCGGFNANIINKAIQFIKKSNNSSNNKETTNINIITVGKKAYTGLVKYNCTVSMKADFEKKDVTTSLTDIYSISRLVLDDYINGLCDKVLITYTDYESALRQIPNVIQLLPIDAKDLENMLGNTQEAKKEKIDSLEEKDFEEYILEPDAKNLLDSIAPKIIEVKLYQALLESDASEHSARMMAMKNASESADDMMKTLSFAYNRARQAGITQEISEISAGKASLE